MEERHIVYRDSNKIIALVIINIFIFLFALGAALNPYRSTISSEGTIRFLGILAAIASGKSLVHLIRSVKDGHKYFVFDSKGIQKKKEKKILWKDIIRMEEMCDKYSGVVLKIYYKGQNGENMEEISFNTVKGDVKQIWGMIQEYWEKYR